MKELNGKASSDSFWSNKWSFTKEKFLEVSKNGSSKKALTDWANSQANGLRVYINKELQSI